nr:unnamed protein product [Digitaria exilis]
MARVVPCLQDQEKALLRLKSSFTVTTDSIMEFRSYLNLARNNFNVSELPSIGFDRLSHEFDLS